MTVSPRNPTHPMSLGHRVSPYEDVSAPFALAYPQGIPPITADHSSSFYGQALLGEVHKLAPPHSEDYIPTCIRRSCEALGCALHRKNAGETRILAQELLTKMQRFHVEIREFIPVLFPESSFIDLVRRDYIYRVLPGPAGRLLYQCLAPWDGKHCFSEYLSQLLADPCGSSIPDQIPRLDPSRSKIQNLSYMYIGFRDSRIELEHVTRHRQFLGQDVAEVGQCATRRIVMMPNRAYSERLCSLFYQAFAAKLQGDMQSFNCQLLQVYTQRGALGEYVPAALQKGRREYVFLLLKSNIATVWRPSDTPYKHVPYNGYDANRLFQIQEIFWQGVYQILVNHGTRLPTHELPIIKHDSNPYRSGFCGDVLALKPLGARHIQAMIDWYKPLLEQVGGSQEAASFQYSVLQEPLSATGQYVRQPEGAEPPGLLCAAEEHLRGPSGNELADLLCAAEERPREPDGAELPDLLPGTEEHASEPSGSELRASLFAAAGVIPRRAAGSGVTCYSMSSDATVS